MSRNDSLISEITSLERILKGIPSEKVIERAAFEDRLEAARERLALKPEKTEPERTKLTFRGAPVSGSLGMKADFGGRATLAFSDAFAAIVAGKKDRLKFMGPIPEKARTQLLITGTVTGSFGFEFELPDLPDSFFPQDEGPGGSIATLLEVMQVSANGKDEEVADVVGSLHPRAVRKVAEFLELLSDNQAWCAMEFRHKVFRYKNADHLKRSVGRLSSENLKENSVSFTGEFQGVLPRQRTFEFLNTETREVLRGKVSASIEDVSVLNRRFLHRAVNVSFSVVQVGQARPRYFLDDVEKIRVIS